MQYDVQQSTSNNTQTLSQTDHGSSIGDPVVDPLSQLQNWHCPPSASQLGMSGSMNGVTNTTCYNSPTVGPVGSMPSVVLGHSTTDSDENMQIQQQQALLVQANKCKLVQRKLVLLMHAQTCQRREQTSGNQSCTLPYCRTMKTVLNHMTSCNRGLNCDGKFNGFVGFF